MTVYGRFIYFTRTFLILQYTDVIFAIYGRYCTLFKLQYTDVLFYNIRTLFKIQYTDVLFYNIRTLSNDNIRTLYLLHTDVFNTSIYGR